MPYCVGLTGTIASGKTTALMYFKSMGIAVVSADEISRALVAPHQPAFLEIQAHFGQAFITAAGTLNRRKLRAHIVNHPADKAWLEACLHPKIRQDIENYIAQSKTPYVIVEIPLLTRREDYPYLDRVLLIKTTPKHQISRMMTRDHCTENEAMAFIDLQKHYHEAHAAIADDIVENDKTLAAFLTQLEGHHQAYLNAAKNASISCSVSDLK